MTSPIKSELPEAPCDKECTHKHIIAERITVTNPSGIGAIEMMATRSATGLWVQTGRGQECVGLVAQEGVGPFLVIYDAKAQGLPLAICGDQIQLHTKPGEGRVVIAFADLLEAVRQVVKAKPEGA